MSRSMKSRPITVQHPAPPPRSCLQTRHSGSDAGEAGPEPEDLWAQEPWRSSESEYYKRRLNVSLQNCRDTVHNCTGTRNLVVDDKKLG